jgi:two-component system LytT family sensor kinase
VSGSTASYITTTLPSLNSPRFQPAGLLKKRWLYHILFWVNYFLFVLLLFYSMSGIKELNFYVLMLLFFPCELLLVYFNFYVLIPRLLFAGKYVHYVMALALSMAVLAVINTFIHRLNVYLGSPYYATGVAFTFRNLFTRLFELFSLTGLTTGIKLAKDWILQLQWIREKEKQYLETELNFLKSQINPHFFFNTLNNLYSLTLKKSDLAPEVVLKLSDLMSYMLYESNTPKIALDKEVAYLRNYIDVERLRFGQRLQVGFEVSGSTEQVQIPPMILILFVENSFKHGTRHIIHAIYIHISLKVEDGFLFFRVENPVDQDFSASDATGIGLKNAGRRLELLYGPNNYSLDMTIKDNIYIVSLKIPVW